MIGHIKEIKVVAGQVIAIIETGSGPAVTGTIMPMGSLDFQPLVGDSVVFHKAGQEIVVTAVFSEDSTAGPGETVLFSRSGPMAIMAIVHLKADGVIEIKPGPGQVAGVGTATDFVAMATKVDLLWSTLWTVFNSWVVAPTDGGGALKTAFLAAFPPPGPNSVASTNLKAD